MVEVRPINFPADVAIIPSVTKVTAVPTENTAEYANAFFVSFSPIPPTYPTTNGMFDKEQGVKDVSTPAIKASSGASHILFPITSAICERRFGSLDDLGAAVADLQFDKCLHRVGNGCSIGYGVLNTAIRTVFVIRPDKDTTASHASACRDSNITGRSIIGSDSQLISGNREVEAGCTGREGKLGKHVVRVSQFSNVLTAVPFQFNGLCLAGALTHKARILNMAQPFHPRILFPKNCSPVGNNFLEMVCPLVSSWLQDASCTRMLFHLEGL